MNAARDLLRLEGVGKRFGGLSVLKDLHLTVAEGAIHSVIGPNGAGKTTVFNCIMSMFPIDAGSILFADHRIDGLQPHVVARHGIARTYQNIRLFLDMTVMDNILVGMHARIGRPILSAALALPSYRNQEAQRREEAGDLLAFVGLPRDGDQSVRGLSYGDQRRVEIARALASRPRLLLLDEPAAGMNPAEGQQLVELIRRMRERFGVTVMLVEHQMRIVMSISDTVTVLDRGSVLANGPPAMVQSDTKVIDAYLGRPAAEKVAQVHARGTS